MTFQENWLALPVHGSADTAEATTAALLPPQPGCERLVLVASSAAAGDGPCGAETRTTEAAMRNQGAVLSHAAPTGPAAAAGGGPAAASGLALGQAARCRR